MPYQILVEPAHENRSAFARWCLAQNPPIMTVSSHGSQVPADLFAAIPGELLDGARVDGHVYRHVIEGFEPDGDGYKPVPVPVDDGVSPEPVTAPKTRQRRQTRKVAPVEGKVSE